MIKKEPTKDIIFESIFDHVKNCSSCKKLFGKITNHSLKTMIKENTL